MKGAAAMKNQAIQYLALDVHHATIVATARDEHRSIPLRSTVPTEASAIVGLVRSFGRVQVAYEDGTQAQWLHDLLDNILFMMCDSNINIATMAATGADRPPA
jgi:hypothetical protein